MSTYPSHVHAWTQSDRLALAMNFQDNGFDLFHPATYNLLTKDGITQVDFPIHDYSVALISSALKLPIVSTFRWYMLILSFLGSYFLFRSGLNFGLSSLRSALMSLFVFTLPFFSYYANGFLPSAAAFNLFLFGVFFLSKDFSDKKKKNAYWALFFFSLAALSRSPFLLFLMVIVTSMFYTTWKKGGSQKNNIIATLLSLNVFFLYFFYNRYLGEEYGSMFLGQFLSPDSFADFIRILKESVERWSGDIISPFHGILLIALLLAVGTQLLKNPIINQLEKRWLLILLLSGIASCFFALLMGKQFVDHDYYLIDAFFPTLVFLLIFCMKRIKIDQRWYTPITLCCFIFGIYFFSYAKERKTDRYTPEFNDRIHYAYTVYKNAKADFKQWNLDKDDTLIVLEANSTNIPFTILGHKGFTSLNSLEDSVISILKKPHDYVLLIDSFFRLDTYRDYPDIINRLELVKSNKELSLYQLKEQGNPANFFDNAFLTEQFDFEKDLHWTENWNTKFQYQQLDSSRAYLIDSTISYGLAYENHLHQVQKDDNIHVIIRAEYAAADSVKVQAVCKFGDYYMAHYLENTLEIDGEFHLKQYQFKIPTRFNVEGEQIKVFFYNPEKEELLIDNYSLLIYQ